MATLDGRMTTEGRRGVIKGSYLWPEQWIENCLSYFEEYKIMPLVNLVIALIVVGLALWLINRFIPMQSGIKTILNVVVVVAVGIWVLQATGLWGPISNYRISR